MKYIVVSGIDGSGKTTVINSLKKYLEDDGKKTFYIWMRYNHYLIKIMNGIARILGYSVKTHTSVGLIWQHQYYKSKIFFKFYILCSYIDNWIGSIKLRRIPEGKYDYIIIDRWINDVLIDLGSEAHIRNILESRWYERFQQILLPATYQFVVYRNIEDIAACRPESQYDPNFVNRIDLYEELMKKTEIIAIDNNSTIIQSVEQIIKNL